MVEVISSIPVYLPDDLINIDEKSFRQFMQWEDDRKMLNRFIVSRFRDGALKTLPYTDENRPDKPKGDPVKIGQLELMVVTTPTHKKISYATVYEKFKDFIEKLEEFYKDEMLRKDFRTLGKEDKKELYVDANMVLEKIKEYQTTSFEGKEGISQKVTLVSPAELLTEIPNIIHLNLEVNYGASVEFNATKWQQAINMVKEATKRTVGYKIKEGEKEEEEDTENYVKRFKKLVLEDSLQTLGGKPKVPVALKYDFETVGFRHQIEPRETAPYQPIINRFTKEAPKLIKSNSKIGDLAIIKLIAEGAEEKLREKGLVTEEFMNDYNPTKDEGKMFVRIEGLKKRLKEYYKPKETLEQNFFIVLPRL